MVEQLPEEVELLRRQLDLGLADLDLAAARVDDEVAVAQLGGLGIAALRRRPPDGATAAPDEPADEGICTFRG